VLFTSDLLLELVCSFKKDIVRPLFVIDYVSLSHIDAYFQMPGYIMASTLRVGRRRDDASIVVANSTFPQL
jgi:hypothetical protein